MFVTQHCDRNMKEWSSSVPYLQNSEFYGLFQGQKCAVEVSLDYILFDLVYLCASWWKKYLTNFKKNRFETQWFLKDTPFCNE